MDEQKTQVTAQETPEEPKTAQPEEPKDVEQAKTTTPPSSTVDVETKETGEDSGIEAPDSKTANEQRSEKVKMSTLEKENNELRQAKQLLDALDKAAANDPDFMKVANKKLVEQGVLPEEVLEQLDEQPKSVTEDTQSSPVIKWAQQKMQEEQAKQAQEREQKEEFFINFEKERPDLIDENPELTKINRKAVGIMAHKLMLKGVEMEDAYERAYTQIFHPEKLVEKGELQGMAKAQSATPAEQSASGGSAKSSGTVTLTPEQKEMARLFGVSEEAYAKRISEE